jgi:hypothetical protein
MQIVGFNMCAILDTIMVNAANDFTNVYFLLSPGELKCPLSTSWN